MWLGYAAHVVPDPTLQRAREALTTDLHRGEPGGVVLGRWADVVRLWVADHAASILEEGVPKFGPMALASVGALSRRELGPHSDVDLVLLAGAAPETAGPQAFDDFVASVVHPMWDAGLRPNLVVDDSETWLAEANEDLTRATALLDVRPLAGDPRIVADLRAEATRRFCGEQRGALLERLDAELEERHDKYGGTVYLVEPDLKYGPGGLRDLASLQWHFEATFAERDIPTLVQNGAVAGPVGNMVAGARDTLLRLRAALQLAAKRDQDRLVFQYQELMPPLLGLVDPSGVDDATLVQAIERAMQDYFRAAHAMVRYGQRLRERCRPAPADGPQEARRIDERFTIEGGKLRGVEPELYRTAPVLALEALALARDYDVPLSGETFDGIAEAVAAPAAFALADEPVAQRRMLDLLCAPDDAANPSALALCNELGVLERVVPEFGPIRGRMQHEQFHVYTVDQHTLQAIAMLKRIARGEHNKDFPLATALHLEIDDPRVLYLAALVHDTGKALAGEQCDTGAEVARHVAIRAGLSEADVERCAMLVREHLTMPLLSQKRDLSDPLLIADFASRVDRQSLRELYLLSMVDTASVRPGNLTSWKLTLLDELYLLTAAYLARGRARPRPAAREGELSGMPERYYSLYHRELRQRHERLVTRLLAEQRQAIVELDTGSGALRLTLVARDRPGLLARAATVLDEHGIEVMAADVFTQEGNPPIAVDVFRIVSREGPEQGVDVETLTQVEQGLDDNGSGETLLPLPARRRRLGAPVVRPRVTFDTDPSRRRTIVDVECGAGTGVLRRMTMAFASLGIEIEVARCSSEADRIQNVFYVQALDKDVQEALRDRLVTTLDYR